MVSPRVQTGMDLALFFFNFSQRNFRVKTFSSRGKYLRHWKSGYTDIFTHTHIRHHHLNEVPTRFSNSNKLTFSAFKSITYPRKSLAAHLWLDCNIMFFLPFHLAKNTAMRKNFKHNSMCRKTFISYIPNLTLVIETVIRDLYLRFYITFNFCAGGETHYVISLS